MLFVFSRFWWPRFCVAFGLLLCLGWGGAVHAQEVETDAKRCAPQLLGSWGAKETIEGQRPAEGWTPLEIPHTTSSTWPGWQGPVWHRLDWQLNCSSGRDAHAPHLGLAISGIRMAGTVYWNDELLWSDRSLVEPYSRSWNMPRWWPVSTQGRGDVQTVWVRVVGAQAKFHGLGYVQLGDMASIQETYDSRYWRQRSSYMVTAGLSITLACVALMVWLWQRSEKIYLWMGLMQVCWTLYLSVVLSTQPWPWLSSDTLSLLNLVSFMLYAHCFLTFILRFHRQRWVRTERVLWGVLAVWIALLLPGENALLNINEFSLIWGIVVFCAACLYGIYRGLRTRDPQHLLLAAACAVMVVVALHDIAVALRGWDNDQTWSYFSWPLNIVVLAALLGWQVASHMRRVDRFNIELKDHVAHARAELAQVLAQQHAKDLQSAKLQERVQLAHDLHDGLGGSLVRSMALVEQAPQQLSNDRVMSLLKTLRDDLRQVIDTGSSSGVTVPETPTRWIAPLRHRFTHILDELNMQAQWQVDDRWRTTPTALQCLGMLRFLEEAFANIIKHSRAQQVQVVCVQPDEQTWVLSVQDDGVGFDWNAVQQAGMSVGMRSMQARIARIGGSVQVQSQPGCTLLTARIHIKATPLLET